MYKKLVGKYTSVYQPDHPKAGTRGYILEHVLIAEQTVGRLLCNGEVVHHVDGNSNNNERSNLVICQSQY